MSITIFSLNKRHIPLKAGAEGLDVVEESDLDFRAAGRKAAAACYEQGKSFKITIEPTPDGVDCKGLSADYDATVEAL
ncbi:MAG: hypothetical protein K2W33_13720, partial [Burkholderiales bacterium]|nr:hypothetical protein [Burkholderiales bacterium]